ncbi:odorant receptor [Holotrichia oblita]|uniref:Odorant receptor n=1 Tax=Holotrichia oblita TaxID=644536 RepID=A0ACB9SM15_HOLOL|nr:odorant receptor [Holotrichia oblita]
METKLEPKLGYFHIQQFALRFVGVSLRGTETLYYQVYSILCIFLVVTFTIQETYGAFSFTDDIDRLSNVISIATSHILGVVKIFVISKNKAGFMNILNALENGLFAPNFERGGGLEEELMSKCITQTFRQVPSNEYNNSVYQKENLQEKFKYIVTYHQSILDLAEQFEKYFSFLILTVFLANTIVLCFTMYHASLYPMSNAKALGDFCYVTVICIQLLLFCYWGNEVALESQSLTFSCYEVNFVDMPKHFQKHLIFMMQRCQRPVILTAGKFINLSLSAYVSVIVKSFLFLLHGFKTKWRFRIKYVYNLIVI